MNKQEIYNYLKSENIEFEVTEHKAVFNMAEMSEVELPYPEADAKNLFVCDDKKRNYYLITVKGNKMVNLKEFKQNNGTRNLSFASEKDLADIMELIPGAVTPLGVLNDSGRIVQVFIDSDLADGLIGVHPNENTATVWLKTSDLIKIIEKHGNTVKTVKI